MYKIFFRYCALIIALFICINGISANQDQGSTAQDTTQTQQETTEAKQQATSSFSVKRALGKSLFVCALGYYAYYCGKRFYVSYIHNKKLSNPFTTPFFSNYRLSDSFGDKICWVTAKAILDNKAAVKKAFYNDLLIPSRIVVNTREYKLEKADSTNNQEKRKEQTEVYQNVIRELNAELCDIKKSIENLAPYANIFNTMHMFAFQDKPCIKLDDIYLVLSTYDQNDIKGFENSLIVYSAPKDFWQKLAKSLLYPKQDDCMRQCWEYIKNYVRVKALRNVIEEDYLDFFKN